jgi:hypothetical protein
MEFFLKIIVSALVIAGVSELSKRYIPIAAILAALPLTSVLAMIWLYRDTKDVQQIANLSTGIFWAVLPSLLFFLLLPLLLKNGVGFAWALLASCTAMFLAYSLYILILDRLGIKL